MTFDYIIIGAGSAGCVLANRLTAHGRHRVLLLEAGPSDQKREIAIPAAFSKLFKTEYDWAYHTTPQAHVKGRELYMPRGKMLGGSSSLNAMIYIRGHRLDYDGWAEAGNAGWGFDEVLPYFVKSEKNNALNGTYHGTDGPLHVSDQVCPNVLSTAFVAGAMACGYPMNEDFNGADQEGFGLYQVNQKDGARWSAASAYLKPAMDRSNLTVLTEALVHRVEIAGGQATGVTYQQGDQVETAQATREVLVCAGAINSPQLLMLSGIGNAAALQAHDLPIHQDLRGVGQNLQDHLIAALVFKCKENISLDTIEHWPHILRNTFDYVIRRKGPLTSNVGEGGGFVRTRPDLPAPDMQYHFAPGFFLEHGFPEAGFPHCYSLGPTLLQPESRGEITLTSSHPADYPRIEPNHLSAEADLQTLIAGYNIGHEIAMSEAFEPFFAGYHTPHQRLETEEEIADHIKAHCEALYHPVGTCKMGHDKDAVVDDQLRVHGIGQLRVVDASIMPTIVRGNTNAPTIMIAEKAADLILADA